MKGGEILKTAKKFTKYNDNVIFDVYVNIHGKSGHIEKYRINRRDYEKALSFGYITKAYFDFKPLFKTNIQGGLYKVDEITFDDKYAYFHTEKGTFSLPKYLYKNLPNKEYVFFAQRVS